MAGNNIQLLIKSFGNADLAKYHDPEALKTLVIEDIDYKAEYKKTNGGDVVGSMIPMMPTNTTLKINASLLKRDNKALYEALRNPLLSGLGSCMVVNGNTTQKYTDVKVETGLKQVGNPSEFSDVVLIFIK